MKKNFFTFLSILSMCVFLVNCGKDGGSTTATTSVGNCSAGQVYTQQGCLNQGICQAGYGQSSNMGCLPAIAVNNSTCATQGLATNPNGGCITQQQCYATYGYNSSYCTINSTNGTGYTCPAGQVLTQMGCLNQYNCPANYGYYTTYGGYSLCYPAVAAGTIINNGWNTGYNNGWGTGYTNPGNCTYKSFYWYCTPW